MKLDKRYLKMALLMTLLVSLGSALIGCSEPEATEPKKAVVTYLEGLRDLDYEKLQQTASVEQLTMWPKEPKELKTYLAETQKNDTGAIKNWSIEDKPYFDPVNNQALIKATILTDNYTMVVMFDIRKNGEDWRIYSMEIESKSMARK